MFSGTFGSLSPTPYFSKQILTEITETKWTYKKVPPYNWIVWFISKDLYDMISAFDRLVPAKVRIWSRIRLYGQPLHQTDHFTTTCSRSTLMLSRLSTRVCKTSETGVLPKESINRASRLTSIRKRGGKRFSDSGLVRPSRDASKVRPIWPLEPIEPPFSYRFLLIEPE